MALPSHYRQALEKANAVLTNPMYRTGEMKPIDGAMEKAGGYLANTVGMPNLGRVVQQVGTGSYSEIDPAQVVRGAAEAAMMVPQVRTTGTAMKAGYSALQPALQSIGQQGVKSAIPALAKAAPAVGNALVEGTGLAATAAGNIGLGEIANMSRAGLRGLNAANIRRDLDIGERGAQNLAQQNPEILARLAQAKRLYEQGVNSDVLHSQTGWRTLPGAPDKQPHWAYEISDHQAKLDPNVKQGYLAQQFVHPELMDAYPDIAFVERNANPSLPDTTRGRMMADKGFAGVMEYNPRRVKDNSEATRNTIHELQHWIQNQEGWPKGSAPKSTNIKNAVNEQLNQIVPNSGLNTEQIARMQSQLEKQFYLNQAGEAQARMAAERAFLNPSQRKVRAPSMDYDRTPEELQFSY